MGELRIQSGVSFQLTLSRHSWWIASWKLTLRDQLAGPKSRVSPSPFLRMTTANRFLCLLLANGWLFPALVSDKVLAEHPHDAMAADSVAAHPLVEPAIEKIERVIDGGPFKAEWSSLQNYAIPQWYKDAKFGIFIHWGAYSVPAHGSEWYPRNMYIKKAKTGQGIFDYHREKHGPQKNFGYKDFLPQFKAEKFDAAQWARLFKQSGAKYVIPVAEHHDGFPMYDCSFTPWDASEMGPKRDVLRELSDSVRAEGMKFGVSSHRAFNWMFYLRDESFDNADPQYAQLYGRPLPDLFQEDAWNYKKHFPPQDTQFKDDWLARSCELVDKYQPDVFWFDFGITPDRKATYQSNSYAEHLKKFAAYYYNRSLINAGTNTGDAADTGDLGIINYKFDAFPETAAVLDKERSKMAEIRTPFWQTDTAVSSSSWGYTENQQYKTPDRLVDDLVDIVSKNGCLLLNVGPRPDGTIPQEDQDILKAIGGWLQINGEAIYNTTYWKTFGEGPTTVSTGHVSEKKDEPFTAEDFRFTKGDEALYITGMAWPSVNQAKANQVKVSQVTIKTFAKGSDLYPEEVRMITMLGVEAKLQWTRDETGLKVQLPTDRPSEFAYVLKIVSR